MVSSGDTRYLLVDERRFLVSQITFNGYFYGVPHGILNFIYSFQRKTEQRFEFDTDKLGIHEYILDVTRTTRVSILDGSNFYVDRCFFSPSNIL